MKKKISILLAAILILITSICSAGFWGGGPIPGIDCPVDPGAFWDPYIPDYADDGNIYSIRTLAGAGTVYDATRNQKWMITQMQIYTQALNMATEIANQVKNLASLPSSVLIASINGINQPLEDVIQMQRNAEGLINQSQSIESSWNKVFNPVDIKMMTTENRLNWHTIMLDATEKTYRDTLRTTGIAGQIDNDIFAVNQILNASKEAEGNKQIKQSQALLEGQNTSQKIRQNVLLSGILSTLSIQNQYYNKQEEESQKANFRGVSSGASDPYHPTKDDEKNFKRQAGKGFVHIE